MNRATRHPRSLAFRFLTLVPALLLVCSLTVVAPALGAPLFTTSERTSSMRFGLTMAIFELEGEIQRFTGSLRLDPKQFERSQLILELDPSSVSITPPEQFKGFNLDGLLEKVPPTPMTFKSTKIVKVANNRYQLHGLVTRKKKTWKVTVPLEVTSLNPPTMKFLARGEISDWDSEIPLPVTPGHDHGEISGSLKFTPTR